MGLEPLWKTSAERPQWIQKTHAVLPIGNWDGRSEGCCLLDDGSFWANINRKQHVFQNYEGGPQWMGTMAPEGCIQYTGDLFTHDPALNGPLGAHSYPSSAYLPRMSVYQDSSSEMPWLTDGKYIYYTVLPRGGATGGASTSDGIRWYRLDPATATTEWIAGAANTEESPQKDSHDGKSATIPDDFSANCCDREYIYWAQSNAAPSLGKSGNVVRRMKLQPPYPIDTLPGLSTSQSWYINGLSLNLINPNTGLPRMYDSDYLPAPEGLAVRGNYLYIFDAGLGGWSSLRRMPKTGGPIATLIYGAGRDGLSDSASAPNGYDIVVGGTPLNVGATYFQKGRPELEGLRQLGAVRFMGNKLFFKSVGSGSFFSGYQLLGQALSYFDIDAVEAQYTKSGPQRINRANPQWKSVHGGSHHFEQFSNYTPSKWQSSSGRAWGWVDGGDRPLVQNPFNIFDINEHAAGWENRVAFVHSEIADMVAPTGMNDTNMNSMVAAWVEPPITGSEYKLTLQFTGDLLKGYAPVRDMGPASAPKEITLG